MNYQVDVIIIGDSRDGNEAMRKIASSKPSIKVAFISKEYKSSTTRDYLNVEYVKDEAILIDYKNRLFGCYLKGGDRIYSTHIIIASGLAYEPLMLNNKQVPNVFNSTVDIPKSAKNQPAIVFGQNNSDVKFALDVARKHKHVYLCTKTLTLENITPANLKKLAETDNIVILPNASLKRITAPEGVLQSVELDNYSTVTCSAIFIKTKASPETAFVSDKLIDKTEEGYLKTTDASQSLMIPKCFAIGSCAEKSTQKMRQAMIELVLNDFTGGSK